MNDVKITKEPSSSFNQWPCDSSYIVSRSTLIDINYEPEIKAKSKKNKKEKRNRNITEKHNQNQGKKSNNNKKEIKTIFNQETKKMKT